jgi:hypothetical protein
MSRGNMDFIHVYNTCEALPLKQWSSCVDGHHWSKHVGLYFIIKITVTPDGIHF